MRSIDNWKEVKFLLKVEPTFFNPSVSIKIERKETSKSESASSSKSTLHKRRVIHVQLSVDLLNDVFSLILSLISRALRLEEDRIVESENKENIGEQRTVKTENHDREVAPNNDCREQAINTEKLIRQDSSNENSDHQDAANENVDLRDASNADRNRIRKWSFSSPSDLGARIVGELGIDVISALSIYLEPYPWTNEALNNDAKELEVSS